MFAAIRNRGASRPGAPFSLVLLAATLPAAAPPASADSGCPTVHTDERVQVVYVYDGDTVKLADGRRIRLIGINTPELDHHGRQHDALAEDARAALRKLLDSADQTLLLQYGTEPRDHYGRLLAHAFLPDGTNVATVLLNAGLATALVVPPNTRGMDCYSKLEDTARANRRGLWKLAQYQALDSRTLDTGLRGFHIIRGTVSAVRTGTGSSWIELQGPLVLRIGSQDRANFTPGYLERLVGRSVETRGWLKPHGKELMINIRHPAALAYYEPRELRE